MLSIAEFNSALESLDLENRPAIVHASLRALGIGAEPLIEALLTFVEGLIMPTFTYKTMITPEVGPPNNGLKYGAQTDLNRMALPFHLDMPADKLVGVLSEVLRNQPDAQRSAHPILSFAGINANDILVTQTLFKPFAPVEMLAEMDGWVLLLGVDHTANTSIHYGEKLARRHQFVRWAMMKKRIVECPNYPGCSDGFEAIRPHITHISRRVEIGDSFIEAIPLSPLLQEVETLINRDPLVLLCQRDTCPLCDAVRAAET